MRKIIVGILAVLVVVIGGGTLWVYLEGEETVRRGVERHGPEVMGADVGLAGVSFRPFSGRAGLNGLRVSNPDGYSDAEAISVQDMRVELAPMSLFSDMIRIREIRIESPRLRIEPGKGGTNLQALQRNVNAFTGPAPEEDPGAGPKPVHISDFHLTDAKITVGGGRIGFSDRTLALADIHLQDIGGEDGVAPSRALELVFEALMPQVQKALASQAGQQLLGQARERISNLEGELREQAEGIAENLSEKAEGVKDQAGDRLRKESEDLGSKAREKMEEGLGGLLGGKKDEKSSEKEEKTPPEDEGGDSPGER